MFNKFEIVTPIPI